MQFERGFGADGGGRRQRQFVAGVHQPPESLAAEGAQGDGELERVGPPGGAQ